MTTEEKLATLTRLRDDAMFLRADFQAFRLKSENNEKFCKIGEAAMNFISSLTDHEITKLKESKP
jgi:hypothetical protein